VNEADTPVGNGDSRGDHGMVAHVGPGTSFASRAVCRLRTRYSCVVCSAYSHYSLRIETFLREVVGRVGRLFVGEWCDQKLAQ